MAHNTLLWSHDSLYDNHSVSSLLSADTESLPAYAFECVFLKGQRVAIFGPFFAVNNDYTIAPLLVVNNVVDHVCFVSVQPYYTVYVGQQPGMAYSMQSVSFACV